MAVTKIFRSKKLLGIFLVLALNLIFATAAAKTVRVGWFESPFNYSDNYDRRFGYAYDYQQKIAAYTGWTYEYVDGTWSELLNKLKTGEIDLLSDVSYTPERAGQMFFSSLPMGAETYFLFTTTDNAEITMKDIASLNGKKIGVNKGSVQRDMFLDWAAENNISAQIVELSALEKDAFQMLQHGEIDAYITLDAYEDQNARDFVPLFKIGQSDYFFAVSNSRPDLLSELNDALSKIHDENRFYNQQLHEKYLATSGTNSFLSNDAMDWLYRNGKIRVGYLDDYLPFCAAGSNGVTGGLKDYLELAAHCSKNARLNFETFAFPNLEAAFEALRAGQIDAVFPVNLSAYDGEKMGFLVTSPVMQTEMYVAVRRRNQREISANQNMIIAVDKLNLNHMTFLRDNFPNWTILDCSGIEDCFSEVAAGTADGAIVSNYRLVQTENLREEYDLISLTTGKSMDFSFAMARTSGEVYYILNKTASLVPRMSINSALTAYSYPENNFSLTKFLKEHWLIVIALIVAAAVLAVVHKDRRAKRRERELAEQLENERRANEVDEIINAVAADYRSVFYVDLDSDRGVCYRAKNAAGESDLDGVNSGDHFNFREKFVDYANAHVTEPFRKSFLQFLEPENIREKLAEEVVTAHRYLAVVDGIESYEMIRVVNLNPAQEIHAVSVGFAEVDSETKDILAQNFSLTKALKEAARDEK